MSAAGLLPRIKTSIPGPRSRELAGRLRKVESPHITYVDSRFPVFWESASGCMVEDVDGNRFLDLCAGFGAAAVGHAYPAVVQAIQQQSARLLHGMGDVHPPAIKVEFEERLASLAPGPLRQVIPATSGAEAVEAALKTAYLATGKPGVIAFYGGYHGLSYGALDTNGRGYFRDPFEAQLGHFTRFVHYPDRFRPPEGVSAEGVGDWSLNQVQSAFQHATEAPVGAVLVEPIQGRGGIVVPPAGWFAELKALCRRNGALLIADEVFTGCGRTGEWFASEEPPDLLCIGKALGGGFPVSACLGTPEVMAAWGESLGEALHTSTFLGHPLGCAAALASLRVIEEEGLLARCQAAGQRFLTGLRRLQEQHRGVGDVRGRGLMIGVEMVLADGSPDAAGALEVTLDALQRGLIVLPSGPHGSVIELVPPYIITDDQIDFALGTLGEIFDALGL